MQGAWSRRSISAVIVWDPVFDYLSTHGGRMLVNDSALPANATSFNICVANKDYARVHPAIAKAFVIAMGDGVTFLTQHRAQALKIMAKAAGISVATARTEISSYQIYTVVDQSTVSVLGTSLATSGNSGTAQSLLNNWHSLCKAGTVTIKSPNSVAPT